MQGINAQFWHKKCRALVLEGGGDRGAYQVGAIRGLVESMEAKESMYDVVSGVSIGSINAIGLSLFKKGDEDAATKWLIDLWHKMSADVIYSNWPGWIIEGAFFRKGLYNNTRFMDFLAEHVHRDTLYRKVVVGATNAQNGTFVRFTEKIGVKELMFDAARASSAFPGFFQSVEYKNMTLIDGGVLINLDIAGAIDRCKEIVTYEEDIIVDIVMCSGDVLNDVDVSKFNSIQMLKRYTEIATFQKTMVWITQGKSNFPRVNFRYIVSPKGTISNEWIPIGFEHKEILRLIELGRTDAISVVEEGPGKRFEEELEFYKKRGH